METANKVALSFIFPFLTGLILWSTIEFLIFYPYTSQDWHKSNHCKVQDVTRYNLVAYIAKDGTVGYTYYSLFTINVLIDGVWRKGFGCGSDYAGTSSAVGYNNTYPYDYGNSDVEGVTGTQLYMPLWYCNECKVCDQFLDEERKCWWFLKQSQTEESIDDVEDFPPNYDVEYPTELSTFIQVRFREEQNFDNSAYIAFYFFTVGLLMGVPVLYWIILALIRALK